MGKNLNTVGGGDSFLVVAAADTPAVLQDRADYVCDGTNLTGGDEAEINTALGISDTVILCPGTYWISGSVEYYAGKWKGIVIASGKTLIGGGWGTVIKLMDSFNLEIRMIANENHADGNNRITVRNLGADGNKANQTAGIKVYGIYFSKVAPTNHELGCRIQDCFIQNCEREGIRFDSCVKSIVSRNIVYACNPGIYSGGGKSVAVSNNICVENNSDGIFLNSNEHSGIIGNICQKNTFHGIKIESENYSTISGNVLWENLFCGIEIYNCDYSVFDGNDIQGNSNYGILAKASDGNTFGNNVIKTNKFAGIYIWTSSGDHSKDNVVIGNVIDSNSQQTNLLYPNIKLERTDYNTITDNVIRKGILAKKPSYGIELAADALYNIVRDNDLYNGGDVGIINDLGVDTEFNNITFQFIQGTTFLSGDAEPKGWEVDLADEFAIALGQLPLELTQVVRIKIWAVGLVAPGAGNGMLLEINMNAGQDDEAYTAEAIAIVNKVNTTDNFAVNDIIHWVVTSADDADIGDLAGGDSLEVKVKFETLANGDIDTDAVFRTVEIEYVT